MAAEKPRIPRIELVLLLAAFDLRRAGPLDYWSHGDAQAGFDSSIEIREYLSVYFLFSFSIATGFTYAQNRGRKKRIVCGGRRHNPYIALHFHRFLYS